MSRSVALSGGDGDALGEAERILLDDLPAVGAERDRVDRDVRRLGLLGDLQRVRDAERVLPVGEQHDDRGSLRVPCRPAVGTGACALQPAREAVAHRRAAVGAHPLERARHRSASVVGATACPANPRRHEPEAEVVGRPVDQDLGRLDGAVSRLGSTSSARIEPETSLTSTTVAARWGAATLRCGRATAKIAPPARQEQRGRHWRRHRAARSRGRGAAPGCRTRRPRAGVWAASTRTRAWPPVGGPGPAGRPARGTSPCGLLAAAAGAAARPGPPAVIAP